MDATSEVTVLESAFTRAWSTLHPAPSLPTDEPFTAGLQPLLRGLADAVGGPLAGRRATAVIGMVGDRFTVTVDGDGVVSRGLLRHHRASWGDAEAVLVEPMAAMAVRRLLARTASRAVARMVPIPGLHWVAQRVADMVLDPIADVAAPAAAKAVDGLPAVLVGVRTSVGESVRLEGPLALTSLLSRGLTEVALDHAARRDVPVEHLD